MLTAIELKRQGWNFLLAASARLGNALLMHPQPHHRGRKWRRLARHNCGLFFFAFFAVVIVGIVGLLIWFISSPQFVKPN